MKTIKKIVCAPAVAAVTLCFAAPAQAQAYPSQPIRLIVPFAAGGGTDLVARLIASEMGPLLKQSVVIENVPGASGHIAANQVAKAAPDGHTLLMVTAAHAVNANLQNDASYDPVKSFAPVALIGRAGYILLTTPSSPADSVEKFIRIAKSSQKPMTFASSGVGSAPQMAGELFQQMAGIDLLHVPFRGGGPASLALLSGQVDSWFGSIAGALPQIKAGKQRALAVTGIERSSALPDVPTIAEAGLPGYDITGWYGIVAPAHTPPAVVSTLHDALRTVSLMPKIKERLLQQEGVEPVEMTPAAFGDFIQSEVDKYANIVKLAKIEIK